MDINKRIFWANNLSYISFVGYIFLMSNPTWIEEYGLLAFLPYVFVAYSTLEFNTRFEPRLKRMKKFTILDFLVRFISMFLCFFITSLSYQSTQFKVLCLLLAILYLFNLFLELGIKRRSYYIDGEEQKEEISANELYYSGNFKLVSRQVISLIESALLGFCMVIIIGLKPVTGVAFRICFLLLVVCALIIYIKMSYTTLLIYYSDHRQARIALIKENISICLMLAMMLAYSLLVGYESFYDFIIYILMSSLLLPRYIIRRKRLEKIYKDYIVK